MKIIKSLVLIFTALFFLSSCNNSNKKQGVNERQTVKIGSILPLTGPLAIFGNYSKSGQEKAIERLNSEQSKYSFEILFEDGKGDPKEGINAYRKMRENKIEIFTSSSSLLSMPLLPLMREDNVLFFPSASHPQINNPNSKYVYRHFVTAEQEVPLLLDSLNKFSKAKTAVLVVNDDFGRGFDNLLNSSLPKYQNVKVSMTEIFEKSQSDFTSLVQKVKSNSPENIIIVGYGNAAGNLVKRLKEQKVEGNIFVSFSFLLTEANKVAGDAMKGVTCVDLSLKHAEKDKPGGNILTYEAVDYGTIYLIGQAIINNGISKDSIINFIDKQTVFNTGIEEMRFEKTHDILPQVILVTFK